MSYTTRRGSPTHDAPPRFTFDPRATPSTDKVPTFVADDTCIVVRGFDIAKAIPLREPTLVSTTATTDNAAASMCDVAQQSAEECAREPVNKDEAQAAGSGERYYPQRGLVIYPTSRTSDPTPPSPDFVPSFPSLGDDCAIESGSEFSPDIARVFRGRRANKQYNGPGQEAPPAEPRPEEEVSMQRLESRQASVMRVQPNHGSNRRSSARRPRPTEEARPQPQPQPFPARQVFPQPATPAPSAPKSPGNSRALPIQLPPRQVPTHPDTPRPSPHSILRASPSAPARFKTGPIDIPPREVESQDPRIAQIPNPRPPMANQARPGPKTWLSWVQTRFYSASQRARWESGAGDSAGGAGGDGDNRSSMPQNEANPNAYDLIITYRRVRQTKELVVAAERLERGSGLTYDDEDEDEGSREMHSRHREVDEGRNKAHLLKDSRWETSFLAW